jgi:hypothetical protein
VIYRTIHLVAVYMIAASLAQGQDCPDGKCPLRQKIAASPIAQNPGPVVTVARAAADLATPFQPYQPLTEYHPVQAVVSPVVRVASVVASPIRHEATSLAVNCHCHQATRRMAWTSPRFFRRR